MDAAIEKHPRLQRWRPPAGSMLDPVGLGSRMGSKPNLDWRVALRPKNAPSCQLRRGQRGRRRQRGGRIRWRGTTVRHLAPRAAVDVIGRAGELHAPRGRLRTGLSLAFGNATRRR